MSKDNINKNNNFEKMLNEYMKDSNRNKRNIRKYHETNRDKKIKEERERKHRQKWNR